MKRFAMMVAACLVSLWASARQNHMTRVDITSQPERASVFVDGKSYGLTPVTLFDLEPGRHRVKYRMNGYEESDSYIMVEDGRPLQHSCTLEPEKGILLVKSEPSGCEITLDGVAMGLTPRLITTIDARSVHKMTLQKTGYKAATFDVKFNGRTPLVRDETLMLDSGVLKIISEPSGAEVTVNGVVRGNTPILVSDVPKGRATVKFRLAGFKDEIISDLMVGAGDHQTVSRVLEGLPGTLSLTSVPEGARFYVNGEYRGRSPLVLSGLQPGDYEVRAENEGFGSETRIVKVMNGATPRMEFRMSNVMGRLEVKSSPSGAQVYFDGRLIGTTSTDDPDAEFSDKLMIENVLEGEHVLVIKKDGYAEQTRHPKIKSSKTSKANVRLRRIFKPDIEIVTDTGVYQGILVSNTPEYILVEVKLGIQRSFPRADIRKVRFLGGKAGNAQ